MNPNPNNQKPKHHVPIRENTQTGRSQNYASAGAPVGYSESAALLKAMKEKKRRCFGGWIVHSTDHAGFPMVSHAIPTAMIQDVCTELSQWYHWTRANGAGIFPSYTFSVTAGDYTFFPFSLSEGAVSMREMMKNPEREGLCRNLFTDLVMLLHRYEQKCVKSAGRYRPLCSISLDTVFMDPNGQLSILPLLCVNNEYPRGFPLEVGTEEVDDTTDLYTAALLTYQVLSGCEYERRSENKRMRSLKAPANMAACMEQSLKLFASQRSSLREVYVQLTRDTAPVEEFQNSSKRSRRPRESRQPREPEIPQEAGFWASMRNLGQKLNSAFNPESETETSRTAGRPKAEPKWPGRGPGSMYHVEFAEDDDEDEYDDEFEYDDEYEYDDDSMDDRDAFPEDEPYDYDESP